MIGFSLVIPAYNEAVILPKTLNALLDDESLRNGEIIVVCNGCGDQSINVLTAYKQQQAEQLNTRSLAFHVIDESRPSKTNALNIGIAKAKGEIVILLDADILVSGRCIEALISTIKEKQLKAMSPLVAFDATESSAWVKAYYDVERVSIYNNTLRLSNVIALSQAGIDTLGIFPDVIADDEYLRRQFNVNEYAILSSHRFTFKAPKTLSDVINVLSRVERGNYQLAQLGIYANESTQGRVKQVGSWRSKTVFFFVKVIAKIMAKYQYHFGNKARWQRDLSTRT